MLWGDQLNAEMSQNVTQPGLVPLLFQGQG